jgi:hypothetical protein
MGIVVLIFFAWLVHQNHRPLRMAALYTGLMALLSLLAGAGLGTLLLNGMVTLAYMSGFFWLLDRYSDTLVIWFVLLFSGALLWFGAGILLT